MFNMGLYLMRTLLNIWGNMVVHQHYVLLSRNLMFFMRIVLGVRIKRTTLNALPGNWGFMANTRNQLINELKLEFYD